MDKKLSQLDSSSAIDYVYGELSGTSKKITAANLFLQGGGTLTTTVTVTSSQILDLVDTPVEIVAAPGANLAIIPLVIIMEYNFVTTAYVSAGNTSINYGTNIDANGIGNANNLILQTESAVATLVNAQESADFFLKSIVNNSPIFLLVSGAENPTEGDGNLVITTKYFLIGI